MSSIRDLQEEVASIPPRALVAYGARCARRVQPVFCDSVAQNNPEWGRLATAAIVAAEAFAATGCIGKEAETHDLARRLSKDFVTPYFSSRTATRKAFSTAVYSVRLAREVAGNERGFRGTADDVLANCLLAGYCLKTVMEAMSADLVLLRKFLARTGEDDPLIDPTVFGDLWPAGMPIGWPECAATYDVFICHASLDKEKLACPVAEALRSLGYRVWLDADAIGLGDFIAEGVDRGILRSRYGAVLLTRHSLGRPWVEYEVGKLREVIPICYGVTPSDVAVLPSSLRLRNMLVAKSVAEIVDRLSQALAEPLLERI